MNDNNTTAAADTNLPPSLNLTDIHDTMHPPLCFVVNEYVPEFDKEGKPLILILEQRKGYNPTTIICHPHNWLFVVKQVGLHPAMNDDNRPFPIQGELTSSRWGKKDPCTIPWWLAEKAYTSYISLHGTRQSLERLAERGGFGRDELLGLLRKIK